MAVDIPISIAGLRAPFVRVVFLLMPKFLKSKKLVSRFGLWSYAKTLRYHFDVIVNEHANSSEHWLAIDRSAAILDRLSIPYPQKTNGPNIWHPFLARIVSAAENMDIDRARKAFLDDEWEFGKHKVNADPVSWSINVPEPEVTLTKSKDDD